MQGNLRTWYLNECIRNKIDFSTRCFFYIHNFLSFKNVEHIAFWQDVNIDNTLRLLHLNDEWFVYW